MICFLGWSKGWRTLSNSKAFFGKTLSEMKRGWEVERVWRCAFDVEANVETYRNFSSSTGTILALFVGSRWWMNSTRYALSDKSVRNFREADCACDEWRYVWNDDVFENRGSNPGSARGFRNAPRCTSWVTTRPAKSTASWFLTAPAFEKGARLFRFARGRVFNLRANASSTSEERLSISSSYRGTKFVSRHTELP